MDNHGPWSTPDPAAWLEKLSLGEPHPLEPHTVYPVSAADAGPNPGLLPTHQTIEAQVLEILERAEACSRRKHHAATLRGAVLRGGGYCYSSPCEAGFGARSGSSEPAQAAWPMGTPTYRRHRRDVARSSTRWSVDLAGTPRQEISTRNGKRPKKHDPMHTTYAQNAYCFLDGAEAAAYVRVKSP